MSDNDMDLINAHTGAVTRINRYYFLSLDELRKFCASQLAVPKEQLFFLTSFGQKLRSSSLEHVDQVYVFDKNLFSTETHDSNTQSYVQRMYSDNLEALIRPIDSPLLDIDLERLTRLKDSRQLIGLLTTNLGWIAAIESDSGLYWKRSRELRSKMTMLFKSIKVANLFIQTYHSEVKKTHDSTMDFLEHLQKQSLNIKWEDRYKMLEGIKLVDGKPLSALLDRDKLSQDAAESRQLNQTLNKAILSQTSRLTAGQRLQADVDTDIDTLEAETENIFAMSDGEGWLKDLKQLCSKTQKDTRHLLEETKGSVDSLSIDIILETFEAHKTDYVASIYKLSFSLYKLLTSYNDLFNKLQLSLSAFLQKLSAAQSELVMLKESLRAISPEIERAQDLESSLAHTIDLPLLYGLYIVEEVRRSEWLKAIKLEASQSNEEFATLREKEIKIRSNWVKNYGDILKLLKMNISAFNNDNLTSIELILNKDDSYNDPGHQLTLHDVKRYVEELQQLGTSSEVIDVLFKNIESVSTTSFKRRPLEKRESRDATIQGYKVRIKKLENLLHQEQFKSFQQWPSSDRMSATVSRHSMHERQNSSMMKESLFKSSTLGNSEDIAKMTEQNRSLSASVKKQLSTIQILTGEMKSLKHELSTKEFDVQRLEHELEGVNDTHASLISQLGLRLSEEEIKSTKLECEVNLLKEEMDTRETSYYILSKERDALRDGYEKKIASFEQKLKDKDVEVESLKQANDKSAETHALEEEVAVLKQQLADKDTYLTTTKKLLEQKTSSLEQCTRTLEENAELLKEKDTIINSINESSNAEVTTWKTKADELEKQNITLITNVEVCGEDYARLKSMKNDLLENMSNRENEFASEKGLHQKEMDAIKSKLEDLEITVQENDTAIIRLTEMESKHTRTIFQLVAIINSLIIKSRDLSDILVTFYDLFCATLKSLGLLAVKSESTGEISIMRVKGLRKANTGDLSTTVDLAAGLKTDLEQDVHRCAVWTELPDKQLLKLHSSDSDIGSESIDCIVDMLIETYSLTTFEEKYLRFVNLVTNLNGSFLSSISKRFKEVEHLAKKELKDNKKLRDSEGKKISVRDFKKDDLVLFLPTRANDSEGASHQWAVFNDMGDVKFLMKNELTFSTQKQWFIGRILEMEEVNSREYLITAEEVVLS